MAKLSLWFIIADPTYTHIYSVQFGMKMNYLYYRKFYKNLNALKIYYFTMRYQKCKKRWRNANRKYSYFRVCLHY